MQILFLGLLYQVSYWVHILFQIHESIQIISFGPLSNFGSFLPLWIKILSSNANILFIPLAFANAHQY